MGKEGEKSKSDQIEFSTRGGSGGEADNSCWIVQDDRVSIARDMQ